jgi:class 3 adenylate cyclase
MKSEFTTLSPTRLLDRLEKREPLLLLDVRRASSLQKHPLGIHGAVPVVLDETDISLPDTDRARDIVVYCLCSAQASSTRVAQWLVAADYTRVAVLEGGLPAWEKAGLPRSHITLEARRQLTWVPLKTLLPERAQPTAGQQLIAETSFLAGMQLPARREMAVMFVDMVDSTRLLSEQPAEAVLAFVQKFMQVVVEVCVRHCGDVHDFEGDGAMLYFASVGEALPAAFELRAALAEARSAEPALPLARFALDTGPLVVGYIGTRDRRALSFIGPSVNVAARILKLAPPEAIIATQRVLEHAAQTDPDLAAQFKELADKTTLKGFYDPITLHVAPLEDHPCSDDSDSCHVEE